MKKHIRSLLLLPFAFAALYGCVKDLGKDNPLSRGEITVSGIHDTTFVIGAEISLYPEIEGLQSGKDYTFRWIIWSNSSRDTISTTRNLEKYIFNYTEGTYRLAFIITDLSTGVEDITITNFSLSSEFFDGFFVLRNDNGTTDFDFVRSDGTHYPEILLNMHGSKMPGIPRSIHFQSTGYAHQYFDEEGKLTESLSGLSVIRVLSDSELYNLSSINFELYKNFEQSFYEYPGTPEPLGFCHIKYQDPCYIGNGRVHTGNSNLTGKFSPPQLGDYHLFPTFMLGGDGYKIFDNVSRSFLEVGYWTQSPETIPGPSPSDPVDLSPTNMDYEMIQWAIGNPEDNSIWAPTGFAIMRNVINDEYKIFKLGGGYRYPIMAVYDLPGDCDILNNTSYGPHAYLNYIYYSTGDNNLWMHAVTNADISREQKVHTFAANERIEFVKHYYDRYGLSFEHLVVATNSPEGWTLYRFQMNSGLETFDPEPLHIYKGTGTLVDIEYRT